MQMLACPPWEYKNAPGIGVLAGRCLHELRIAGTDKENLVRLASNCRPIHQRLFVGLTPAGFPHYAGHYRGEHLHCLEFRYVYIRSDPIVGVPPGEVESKLYALRSAITSGLAGLEAAKSLPDIQYPPDKKVYAIVVFACRVFEEYLRIHPYLNGNGHLARLLVWTLLFRFGMVPKQWPINDRPPEPGYSTSLFHYRRGQPQMLERYVLKCLLGSL